MLDDAEITLILQIFVVKTKILLYTGHFQSFFSSPEPKAPR